MKLADINPTITEKMIRSIARMTDQNDHGGAIQSGLKLLGSDKLIKGLLKDLEDIMDEHEKLGHMPTGLISDRREIYTKMMSIAKKRLNPDRYKRFHNAF